MKKRIFATALLSASVVAWVMLTTLPAWAGGALALHSPGQPFLWPNGGQRIPFNPDRGGLGPLNNADATTLVRDAFQRWGDVTSSSATFVNAGPLPVDVNITNFGPFLAPVAPDGLSAIVYDENGEIFDLLFGANSGILGFAGPEWFNVVTGEIIEGVSFINGGAIADDSAPEILTLFGVLVHEFGHFNNLAHTQVNGVLYIEQFFGIPPGTFDNAGPNPFDLFARPDLTGQVETMYPFIIPGDGTENLKADDIGIFSRLYPAPGFLGATGTITGTILGSNGTTALTGVNVIARNVADPFVDAVSSLSSDLTDDFTQGAPFVGTYTITGLTPGASYVVYVDEIFDGGFSTPPLQPLPNNEEAYNGTNESGDPNTDFPNEFTPVTAVAGSPVEDIDIIFNALPEGPLDIGDDDSQQLFLSFQFELCGQKYDSLFVNSNGSITFGAPDAESFFPNPRQHLGGPPRTAGYWADLSPNLGGTVSFEESDSKFRVSWDDVPEFPGIGANSFEITLHDGRRDDNDNHGHFFGKPADDHFVFKYGDMTAEFGLAGYSCGGPITSSFEEESDISRTWWLNWLNFRRQAAVYEWFLDFDNDLANDVLKFRTPDRFRDRFEPNDSIDAARRVRLPFNTERSFARSVIDDDDVDFFRFKVKAGETVLLEVVPDSPDTLLGLFDTDGNLLLLDDDSFGIGSGSQLLIQAFVDAKFVVGVTTWPDFGFTGAGGDAGRYVLSIRAASGTPLGSGLFGDQFLLGDDDFAEITLDNFEFPYQGQRYGSLFVNSNGNISFGEPDPFGFFPNVFDFLNGPPRIAPYWNDVTPFDPFTGTLRGIVLSEQTRRSVTVHYIGVREFPDDGSNSFSVTLDRSGKIFYDYGPTNRSDSLIGLTEGGGAGDPGPTDLSRRFVLPNQGTVYEQFIGDFSTFGGDDLAFDWLLFKRIRGWLSEDDD